MWRVWVIFFVFWGFFPLPSVCAGSEHAPVHTVPRCSLAGLVNHLPVTGGGNTTAGLAVQRWHLARSWVRCLALLLPLWKTMCLFFLCRRKESSWATLYFPWNGTPVMLQIFKVIPRFRNPSQGLSAPPWSFNPDCLRVCISVTVAAFLSHPLSPRVFERLFCLRSCSKVAARAADQRRTPRGQRGPSSSSRCFPSLLALQLELSLFKRLPAC